jgi:hypothetical protein
MYFLSGRGDIIYLFKKFQTLGTGDWRSLNQSTIKDEEGVIAYTRPARFPGWGVVSFLEGKECFQA